MVRALAVREEDRAVRHAIGPAAEAPIPIDAVGSPTRLTSRAGPVRPGTRCRFARNPRVVARLSWSNDAHVAEHGTDPRERARNACHLPTQASARSMRAACTCACCLR